MSDPGQVLSARQPHTYRPGMKRGAIRTLHDSKWVMLTDHCHSCAVLAACAADGIIESESNEFAMLWETIS